MEFRMSAKGDHDPPHHLIVLDRHAILVDLSKVQGSLHDPTIAEVYWGLVRDGAENRRGGIVTMVDGSRRTFFEESALAPYLNAFRARRDALVAEQQAFQAGEAAATNNT